MHEKIIQNLGGYYLSLLLLFSLSMLSVTSAWAQGGTLLGGTAGSSPTLNVNGYSIEGNDMPALYKEYTYTRKMPEAKGVYWNAKGAETINGAAASSYPARSLDAGNFQELRVQWNDTATVRKLQLCLDGEKGTEIWAELLVRGISITNKIMYHGQAPNYSPKVRQSQVFICAPNVVNPVTGAVTTQPYHFQMESNCSGALFGGQCTSVPFAWVIKYFTADNRVYSQQFVDNTRGDFSKVWLYMYDRVPTRYSSGAIPGTPTNLEASSNFGNNLQWATGPCLSNQSTANPGDPIVRVRIEVSGFGCGASYGRDDSEVDIYYLGLPPAPITLVNNPTQPLCRTTTYQIETAGTPGANGYTWTATNGARVVSIPGVGNSRMSLDLSSVPATATSVTVTVQPAPGSQTCTGANQVTTTVLQLQSSPAPQAMQLGNGRCPDPSPKAVSVDLSGTSGAFYEWTINGANATFFGAPSNTNTTPIVTPNAGAVTVSVRKRLSLCAGFGPTIATTYQIGNLIPACVTPAFKQGDYCGNSPKLAFEAVPSGLNYYFGAISNANTAGVTLTPTSSGSPVWNIGGVGALGPVTFDLTYYVQSNCPGATGSGFVTCTTRVNTGKYIYNTSGCAANARMALPPVVPSPELYPNPTSGLVTIQATAGTRAQQVKVFDAQGSLRYEQHSDAAEGLQSFDVKALAPGMYLVQLFDGQRLTSQRLVKE